MANNSYYLPGDAFFFTRISEKTAAKLLSADAYDFSYGNKANAAYGCGYLGYRFLRIENLDQPFGNAIVEAHKTLRPLMGSDSVMNVFIYPSDYDWKKFGIGLQYNESWVDESLSFGANADHVRLGSFVSSRELVARNWRDSNRVPALGASCPKLPKLLEGDIQSWDKSPATISLNKIKFLIIPDRDFDSYLSQNKGKTIIEISSGNLTTFKYSNGDWRKQ